MAKRTRRHVAYYEPGMNPNPKTPGIDGMWITREPPYTVTRVWVSEDSRPPLADEPKEIRGYAARAANRDFIFRKINTKEVKGRSRK